MVDKFSEPETVMTSPFKECRTFCKPLNYTCGDESNGNVTKAMYSHHVDCLLPNSLLLECRCLPFWADDSCSTNYQDVYVIPMKVYTTVFTIIFFVLACYSAYEIKVYVQEGWKVKKDRTEREYAKSQRDLTGVSTPALDRDSHHGVVSGFFQPVRVRFMVQCCCLVGAMSRVLYLVSLGSKWLTDSSPEISLFFEPGNVSYISCGLLTIMFWKKISTVFKQGAEGASEHDDDVHFFQLIGFYVTFQLTLIVMVFVATKAHIDLAVLFDIMLIVSAFYMLGLVGGSVKFGIRLIGILGGDAKHGVKILEHKEQRKKVWKKIHKIVEMLLWTVPAGLTYIIALGIFVSGIERARASRLSLLQTSARSLHCRTISPPPPF